jgi:hypothetical protein
MASLWRVVGAVLAGYAIFVVLTVAFFMLWGRDPHAAQPATFVVSAIIVGVIVAAGAGYTATLLAGRPDLKAAVAVAVMIALGAVTSLLTSRAGATWSQWAALALMAPSAVAGGAVRLRGRGH